MSTDILSILGLWWSERINADLAAGEHFKLQTQSDPGWLLTYEGPTLVQFTPALQRGFRRSNHNFLSTEFEGDILKFSCGLFDLGQLIWTFVEIVDAAYLNRSAPEVPLFFHNRYSPHASLDLCERLMKWFASRCDYDWEDDGGLDLETTENGWVLRVYKNDDCTSVGPETSLPGADLKVLNRPPSNNEIAYVQGVGVTSAKFPPQLFTEAISRMLEWMEEDWKEVQEFAPSDKGGKS